MCGRFVRAKLPVAYQAAFQLGDVASMPSASYNVAPTQKVAAVRMDGDAKTCVTMRWGLIPSWAKDKKANYINARSETLAEKPAFRAPFKRRRCLILADGYFEWRADGPKIKTPFYFHLADDGPIAFAGIWDLWTKGEEPIESCSIITTGANDLSRPVHDRMPAILLGADADAWIDPDVEDPAALLELLRPFDPSRMTRDQVSTQVNSVKNNNPTCIAAVA